MPRVVHFEIPVADADRAKAFYERVFGWGIAGWGADRSYQLCTTGPADEPGIDGALTTNAAPGSGVGISIGVPSVDEYAARVTQAGGEIVMPKSAIPGVGWLVVCRDSEGNTVGLFQDDATAQ